MAVMLGSGSHRYEVVDNCAKLPPGQEFNADVAGVGVDSRDHVYAFNRGRHPMVVFDRDGVVQVDLMGTLQLPLGPLTEIAEVLGMPSP